MNKKGIMLSSQMDQLLPDEQNILKYKPITMPDSPQVKTGQVNMQLHLMVSSAVSVWIAIERIRRKKKWEWLPGVTTNHRSECPDVLYRQP